MRRLFIIGILVIIMATPFSPGSGKPLSPSTLSGSQRDLNFTSYNIGAYPANLSWINFHNVTQNQDTKILVENSGYGRGLLVSTYAYRSMSNSYLDMEMGLFPNFTIKITFTWAENNSYSQTGENIMVEQGSGNVLQYKFGSNYNNSLYLTGRNTDNLGPEPPALKLYTLQISGSEQNGAVYAGIISGFNQTAHTPVLLNHSYSCNDKNYSILFGGGFSNLTIFNIYLGSTVSGFNTVRNGQPENYRETNISSVNFSGLNQELFARPLVDWQDNTLLYATQKNGSQLYSYNFFNNTKTHIMSLGSSQKLISTAGTVYNGYFLIENSPGTILEIYNYTTGLLKHYDLNVELGESSRVYPSSNEVYLQSANGTLTLFNTTSAEVVAKWSINPDLYPVQSWAQGTSLMSEFYSNSTGVLSTIEVCQNGTMENLSSIQLGEVDLLPSFANGNSSGLASSSSLISGGHFVSFYALAGESNAPYVMDSNFTMAGNSGADFFVQNQSGVYVQEQGFLNLTNVKMNSQFISFNNNLTRGLSVYNSTITLYSTSNETFSPDNLSLSISLPNVLRNKVTLTYAVQSNVNYTMKATLGNVSLQPLDGLINISTARFDNGTYVFSFSATNIAGYSSTYEKTVSIDNYKPSIEAQPGNGSVLLSGSQITFGIDNITGVVYITISGPNNLSLRYSGYAFNVTTPGISGFFNLTIKIVDQFGLSYNYTYTFQIDLLNTSGYTTSIIPNSYLPYGDINLSWTRATFATGYNVTIGSNNYQSSLGTVDNFTRLNLGSGHFTLYVNATGSSGAWTQLVKEFFTVQEFNPSLTVNRTSGTYFSFYGNSPNDSLSIRARTNVTSRFWLNSTGPESSDTMYSGNGTYMNFTMNSGLGLFRSNGEFNITVAAMERSGRESTYHFMISVNNSVPALTEGNLTLYFNTSYAHLPVEFLSNTTYWYNSQGNLQNNTALSAPYLHLGNLTTNIILNAESRWGNWNRTYFRIIYSTESPEISFQVTPNQLVWSRNFTVAYRVNDPVNLSKVVLEVNNNTRLLSPTTNGKLNYSIGRDGTFNFTLEVSDLCGNRNISNTLDVRSSYFPEIMSIKPEISVFMGIAHFSAGLTGKNLESVNLSWSTGGKLVGSGGSLWIYILPGSHTYVLTLKYHSTTISREKKVFTLGFLPELAVFIASFAILLYRKYSGKPDSLMTRELISSNIGKSLREIRRIARKSGIRAGTVTETIEAMQKSNEVLLLKDPDGVAYLMDPKAADK